MAGGTPIFFPSDLARRAPHSFPTRRSSDLATATSSPVDNTANVTTTNDGSDTASASVEVVRAARRVTSCHDEASDAVVGSNGLTVSVTNNGTGIARNVALNDARPADTATSRSLDVASYATLTPCAVAGATLLCAPSFQGCRAHQALHSFPTRRSSDLTSSPVDNTANVTTTNDGSDTASASVE